MARRKLNPKEIEDFRSRGIEAAKELFDEGGLQTVTMRNLARKLGCSATASYRYFSNHEELISALRAFVFSRFAEFQLQKLEGSLRPRQKLARIGRAYVDFAMDNPDEYRLMFSMEPPKTSYAELDEQSRRSFSPLLDAAEEAEESGDIRGPALEFAHLFWAQLHGLVSLEVSNKLNFGMSLEKLLEAFLKSFEMD